MMWYVEAKSLDASEEWQLFVDKLVRGTAARLTSHREERIGQAFMNALWIIRADLYSAITGTLHDPFYQDDRLSGAVYTLYENYILSIEEFA